jgi:putative Mg2+ transporter-C (MgtC) family protein
MELLAFAANVGVALLLGVVIGLERQFRNHPAGLRTSALVCVGAALFVSMVHLLHDTNSPTRIPSYIVSGIGFLGGGVILREGFNVRGMNSAATLWCTAAVGALSGAGFPGHAALGALVVLSVHLFLRPLGRWVDARRKTAPDVETSYRFHVTCSEREENVIRAILLRHVNSHPKMTIQGISSRDAEEPGRTTVVADIFSVERSDRALEDLVARITLEPGVTAVSWDKVNDR